MTGDPDALIGKYLGPVVACVLVVGGILLLSFHAVLFGRNNAAPVVEVGRLNQDQAKQLHHGVDRCLLTSRKFVVEGWIVRERNGAEIHDVKIAYKDGDGRFHALKTTLRGRADPGSVLKARLGDGIKYYSPGFVASIRLGRRTQGLDLDSLYLLYSNRNGRTILPISCPR